MYGGRRGTGIITRGFSLFADTRTGRYGTYGNWKWSVVNGRVLCRIKRWRRCARLSNAARARAGVHSPYAPNNRKLPGAFQSERPASLEHAGGGHRLLRIIVGRMIISQIEPGVQPPENRLLRSLVNLSPSLNDDDRLSNMARRHI